MATRTWNSDGEAESTRGNMWSAQTRTPFGRREVVKGGGVGVTRQVVSVRVRAKNSVYSDREWTICESRKDME